MTPKMCTVGVTGTNGKTTTTSWIAAALESVRKPVFCATTLGFRLGETPLPVTKDYASFIDCMRSCIEQGCRFASIEYTSEALAAGFARAWPCDVAVFTNLSHDHIEAHGSPEHYLASKAQLFVSVEGTAVLNGCDPVFPLLREIVPPHVRVLTYGAESRGKPLCSLDVAVRDVRVSRSGTTFALGSSPCTIRGIGEIYAENAAAALLAATAAGASRDAAIEAIARAPAPAGRFEVVSERPYVVVDYAHTPDALARTCAAAHTLARASQGELIAVFGAGGNRDRAKRAPMGQAARVADRIILTSDNPRDEDPKLIAAAIADGLKGHGRVVTELDRAAAIELAMTQATNADVVLIAGKGHETEQHLAGRTIPFSDRATVERIGRQDAKTPRRGE